MAFEERASRLRVHPVGALSETRQRVDDCTDGQPVTVRGIIEDS